MSFSPLIDPIYVLTISTHRDLAVVHFPDHVLSLELSQRLRVAIVLCINCGAVVHTSRYFVTIRINSSSCTSLPEALIEKQ